MKRFWNATTIFWQKMSFYFVFQYLFISIFCSKILCVTWALDLQVQNDIRKNGKPQIETWWHLSFEQPWEVTTFKTLLMPISLMPLPHPCSPSSWGVPWCQPLPWSLHASRRTHRCTSQRSNLRRSRQGMLDRKPPKIVIRTLNVHLTYWLLAKN